MAIKKTPLTCFNSFAVSVIYQLPNLGNLVLLFIYHFLPLFVVSRLLLITNCEITHDRIYRHHISDFATISLFPIQAQCYQIFLKYQTTRFIDKHRKY